MMKKNKLGPNMENLKKVTLFKSGYSYCLNERFCFPVLCQCFVEYHLGVWPEGIKEITLTLSDKPFDSCYEGIAYRLHRGHTYVQPGNGWTRSSVYPELARQIAIALWKPFDILHPINELKRMWNYWVGNNTFYWNLEISCSR